MADPENQTLRILRDIRASIKALDQKTDKRFNALDTEIGGLKSRLESIRQAVTGESVLGR